VESKGLQFYDLSCTPGQNNDTVSVVKSFPKDFKELE